MLMIKVWTLVFGSFFIPMNQDATVTYESKDGVTCIAKHEFKQKRFSLDCQKNLKRVLYFEDSTPELKTTIMTGDILIKINN